MNYFLAHKSIFSLSILCLLCAFLYSMFNRPDASADDKLFITNSSGHGLPESLKQLEFEKSDSWNAYPIEGDLFTSNPTAIQSSSLPDEEPNTALYELAVSRKPCDIQLDGWANVKGKMVFVFSSTALNASCLGSVGDSFEDMAFTILSYDFTTIENQASGYSVPLVTILDKELNERVVLTPASFRDLLNEKN